MPGWRRRLAGGGGWTAAAAAAVVDHGTSGTAAGALGGFTLVELLIVAVMVGVLAALVLPTYSKARATARAVTRVNAAVSLAMECRLLAISGLGAPPASTAGIVVTCTADGGTVSTVLEEPVAEVRCLNDLSGASESNVVITVSSPGSISCAFS